MQQNQYFAEALSNLDAYTRRGKELSYSSLGLMSDVFDESGKAIEELIGELADATGKMAELKSDLASQFDKVNDELRLIPYKTGDAIARLPEGRLEISLFGRTMAGKSTLMSILTHGDGSQIGNGSQRTTRDVRTYDYQNLKVTDMPGTGAFEGDDDRLAMATVERGDLVVFLIADDAPQYSDAEFLSRVKHLGKPVIFLFNVKKGADSESDLSDVEMEDFIDDIDEVFADETDLEEARKSLVAFGPKFDQDWSEIPCAYSHLKSAYMAQQESHARWANELLRASRFEAAIGVINREVRDKGTFFRLKSYIDAVSTPLEEAAVELFGMCVESNGLARAFQLEAEGFDERITRFADHCNVRIDAFVKKVSGELQADAATFSEDHFADADAGEAWRRTVVSHGYAERAQRVLDGLAKDCQRELREMAREMSFDLKLRFGSVGAVEVVPRVIVDGKRIAGWSSALLGVGAFALGLSSGFAVPALIVGALSAVTGVAAGFLKGGDAQRDEARRKLRSELGKAIDSYVQSLREAMMGHVEGHIIEEGMRSVKRDFESMSEWLVRLASRQREFGVRLAYRHRELSTVLVREAFAYLGYARLANDISTAVRVTGTSTLIAFRNDNSEINRQLFDRMGELLHEDVRGVAQNAPNRLIPLSHVAYGALHEGTLLVERVAGIPVLNINENHAGDPIPGQLAMRLTGILDMER